MAAIVWRERYQNEATAGTSNFCYCRNEAGNRPLPTAQKRIPMEFTCALSVDGSLAFYYVQKEADHRYQASLRSQRTDVPAQLILEKQADGWVCTPFHEVLCTGLSHAIEASDEATEMDDQKTS